MIINKGVAIKVVCSISAIFFLSNHGLARGYMGTNGARNFLKAGCTEVHTDDNCTMGVRSYQPDACLGSFGSDGMGKNAGYLQKEYVYTGDMGLADYNVCQPNTCCTKPSSSPHNCDTFCKSLGAQSGTCAQDTLDNDGFWTCPGSAKKYKSPLAGGMIWGGYCNCTANGANPWGTKLVLTTSNLEFAQGSCEQLAFAIQNNADANATNPTAETKLKPVTGLKYYSASGCATEITKFNFSTGGSKIIWFKATPAATYNTTAVVVGLDPLNFMITSKPAVKINFIDPPSGVSVASCTPITVQPTAEVNSQDKAVFSYGSTVINMYASMGNYYTTSNCTGSTVSTVTVTNGNSQATLYYEAPSSPNSITLSASSGSLGGGAAFSVF